MRGRALHRAMQVIPCMLVLCWSGKAFAQNEYPADLLPAARAEATRFLSATPRDFLEKGNYIIKPTDSIANMTLGEPYRKYRLERNRVLELDDTDSFKTCLTFMVWYIPIYFSNEPRTLIAMYNANGIWKFGGMGGDPAPFLEARALWPMSNGYKISYVKDVGGLDYFMIERDKDVGLYSFREETEKLLGIRKDASGRFPLLTIPYVVQKLKTGARPEKGWHVHIRP